MKRFFGLILTLGLTVGSTGCSTNFPYGTSWDRHNFQSTSHLPITVELFDTVSREVVWSLDIPVGKKAVVDLEHRRDWAETLEPASPAYQVSWKVMNPGDLVNYLDNTQMLSGNPVQLRWKKRPSPELPVAAAPGEERHDYSGRPYPAQPAPKAAPTKAAEPTPTPTPAPAPAPTPKPEPTPAPAPEAAPAPESAPEPAKPTPEDLEGALEK